MEKLEDIYIGGMLSEVFLQKHVDGHFQHECIVDGDHAYAGLSIPTWLTAACDRGVHYVVGDQEESL